MPKTRYKWTVSQAPVCDYGTPVQGILGIYSSRRRANAAAALAKAKGDGVKIDRWTEDAPPPDRETA
jgi:hypothetical protein